MKHTVTVRSTTVYEAMQWLPADGWGSGPAEQMRDWLNSIEPQPRWTTEGVGSKCVIVLLNGLIGRRTCRRGDWILLRPPGTLLIVPDEQFRTHYEQISVEVPA